MTKKYPHMFINPFFRYSKEYELTVYFVITVRAVLFNEWGKQLW